jgi:hypothetical protein
MPSVAMEPWMSEPNDWWTIVNRVRAQENLAYLVAPNAAWMVESSHPRSYSVGKSQIVDFNGVVMAEASSSNETVIGGILDIDRLRKRRKMAPFNFLAELRTELFRPTYAKSIYPANMWLQKPPKNYDETDEAHKKALRNLTRLFAESKMK